MPPEPIPPGPKCSWLFGVSPMQQGSPIDAVTNWARQYGDVVSWRTAYVRIYLLSDPADIETVLVTRSRSFIKGRGLQANRKLFGNGLLTSEGELWLRQRRLIQPAFQRERVAGAAPAMVSCAAGMLDGWRDGDTRDVHRDLMRLSLEIAGRTLFGVSLESQADHVEGALALLVDAGRSMRRLFPLLRHLPTAANRSYARAVRDLDRVVYGIIERRRSDPGASQDDLLSRLIRARYGDGSSMTDRQLRDEAITLLLAGHETTAIALSWTAYLLAQHPEIQERVHAELDAVLAGRLPTAEDLPHLPYTERVLRESLRLYPPAWMMPRIAIEDCEIHGYRIRKGASVLVSQWIVHRNPRFYADPLRFDPDRWTEQFARSLPHFAYFPFGAGPRICIGNSFALMEASLILAAMGQRFRLRPANSAPVEPLATITLRPKGGVWLILTRRR
jgi:cytochrome P450